MRTECCSWAGLISIPGTMANSRIGDDESLGGREGRGGTVPAQGSPRTTQAAARNLPGLSGPGCVARVGAWSSMFPKVRGRRSYTPSRAMTTLPPTTSTRSPYGSRAASTRSSSRQIAVNSAHHQCVREPGRDIRIAGTAPDGTPEIMRHTRSGLLLLRPAKPPGSRRRRDAGTAFLPICRRGESRGPKGPRPPQTPGRRTARAHIKLLEIKGFPQFSSSKIGVKRDRRALLPGKMGNLMCAGREEGGGSYGEMLVSGHPMLLQPWLERNPVPKSATQPFHPEILSTILQR